MAIIIKPAAKNLKARYTADDFEDGHAYCRVPDGALFIGHRLNSAGVGGFSIDGNDVADLDDRETKYEEVSLFVEERPL